MPRMFILDLIGDSGTHNTLITTMDFHKIKHIIYNLKNHVTDVYFRPYRRQWHTQPP